MYRVWDFVRNYSLLLIAGAVIALIWANLDPAGYRAFVHYPLVHDSLIGYPREIGAGVVLRTLTVQFLVNDMLMALFFAIAAKEVWEAVILKNGSLRGRKAVTPLVATLGGMLGPVVVYLGLAAVLGSDTYDAVARGWAVPTATDLAFAYVVGRIVFGPKHPALRFLLLLAIADDAGGMIILALFYPSSVVVTGWLLLSLGAAVAVYVLFNWLPGWLDRGDEAQPRATAVRLRLAFWPYLIAGCLSWYGFHRAGLHPALGLLPIVPTVPHADRAFGVFSEAEQYLTDLLNRMEHLLKHPVEIVLFLFGLVNAGVVLSAGAAPTWLVLAGLVVGKPLGILTFGWIAARGLGFGLPKGMGMADLAVVGCVAGIGFTVALVLASVAYAGGAALGEAAKLGAMLSLVAAPVALVVARLLGVVRQP